MSAPLTPQEREVCRAMLAVPANASGTLSEQIFAAGRDHERQQVQAREARLRSALNTIVSSDAAITEGGPHVAAVIREIALHALKGDE